MCSSYFYNLNKINYPYPFLSPFERDVLTVNLMEKYFVVISLPKNLLNSTNIFNLLTFSKLQSPVPCRLLEINTGRTRLLLYTGLYLREWKGFNYLSYKLDVRFTDSPLTSDNVVSLIKISIGESNMKIEELVIYILISFIQCLY